ncbi:hypothetical protein [Paenibacillus wynnii]|uniref:hypothetical protein n=1 Tax=Paenibacillus wynnii TaxID=268407 RepID=UPI0012FCF4A9|nr:hypothetical protein [Paenibacillus wynnii]
MFQNLIFALIVAIPFSVVNFNGYLMGGPPTQAQVIASFLFNMIWLIFGLIMAIKARRNFITFTTIYWFVGGLLGTLAYLFESLEMALIPVFIFAGPSYGLNFNSVYIDFLRIKFIRLFSRQVNNDHDSDEKRLLSNTTVFRRCPFAELQGRYTRLFFK